MKNRLVDICFIIFPLIIGAYIYYKMGNVEFLKTFGIAPLETLPNMTADKRRFIRNYLPDILWSFSFSYSIFVIAEDISDRRILLFMVLAFAILMESLQLIGIVKGTFDYMDILYESIIIIIVYFITFIRRNEK